MPTPARHALGDLGGLGAWAVAGERRRRAARHHRRADPTIDFIWNLKPGSGVGPAASRVVGREHVEAARAGGAVVAVVHLGNWDMAATIAGTIGLDMTTVMAPIGPPAVTELVAWARRRNGLEIFTPDRAARGLLRAARRRRFVAVLCDIPGAGPETVVQYRGGPVVFSTVPAWLAQRTGAPLLPVSCVRGGPGHIVTVHPPVPTEGRTEAEVMQAVADVLDADAAAFPEQWYPFSAVYADRSDGRRPGRSGGAILDR